MHKPMTCIGEVAERYGLDAAPDLDAGCWVLWTSQRHASGEQEYILGRTSVLPKSATFDRRDAEFEVAKVIWEWCEGRAWEEE